MLDLNDPRWQTFNGGYQVPYDASVPLKQLEATQNPTEIDKLFKTLWRGLHHQGDVNIASYMALPHLIRIAKEKKLTQIDISTYSCLVYIIFQGGLCCSTVVCGTQTTVNLV